jgi:hypothetical protein
MNSAVELRAAECGLTVAQYLSEVEECRKADERMVEIDKLIAQMTPQQRSKREETLEKQRKAFHTVLHEGSEKWIRLFLEADNEEFVLERARRNPKVFPKNLAMVITRIKQAASLEKKKAECTVYTPRGGKHYDLTGQRFGRLTVLSKRAEKRNGGLAYNCLCDCGKQTVVQSGNLRSGTTRSCGRWCKVSQR